jgi:Cof subfamily protein (haloacid dehalogenase superfamily)
MAIRLVATDLDGTLLDPSGAVHPRTAAAVAAARAVGIHVVPVTGRPPNSVWDIAAAAGLGPLGVCANGGATIDLTTCDVLVTRMLAKDTALRLATAAREATPGILLAVDVAEAFWHEPGFFGGEVGWDDAVVEVDSVPDALGPDCFKLVARVPGMPAPALIAHLEQVIGTEGHVTTSGLDWVEIGAAGVTKAFAMDDVCDRLEVSVEEVVAVGDNFNDLPLLAWAGRAMAPANAVEEVLATVDRVLPSNGEHAVAVLLEELVEEAVAGR